MLEDNTRRFLEADYRILWGNEQREIENFMVNKCCINKCKLANGRPCSDLFGFEELSHLRQECAKLDVYEDSKNRLDLCILAELRALTSTGRQTVSTKKGRPNVRQRSKVNYMVKGYPVCQATFLFAHRIKIKRFKRLLKVYKTCGVTASTHGNSAKLPKATPISDVEKAVSFIGNYTEQNAVIVPGGYSNGVNGSLKLLPASESKYAVYVKYQDACRVSGNRPLSFTTFRKFWRTCCPDILLHRPRTHLCGQCQDNYNYLGKLTLAAESEKILQLEKMKRHLDAVDGELSFYNTTIENSRPQFEAHEFEPAPRVPCSFQGVVHYSFDMTQQVHIPSDPLRPGPALFLAPYKVAILGVMCDTSRKQCNFLVPESVVDVRGANNIVSMLHFYFEYYGYGERDMYLHADSSVAQNRNNVLACYLAWRVLMGLNVNIRLSFLPVGHTNFSCYWAFGLLKNKFRSTRASSVLDVCSIVEASTPKSHVNFAVPTASESGKVIVPCYDWQEYFSDMKWRRIPRIAEFNHFSFSGEFPGQVKCSLAVDAPWTNFTISHSAERPDALPAPLVPAGLSRDRQEYLFRNVRQYCSPEAADLLCPRPLHLADNAGAVLPTPACSAPWARKRFKKGVPV